MSTTEEYNAVATPVIPAESQYEAIDSGDLSLSDAPRERKWGHPRDVILTGY